MLFGASTCQKPFLVVSRLVLFRPSGKKTVLLPSPYPTDGKGSEMGLRQPPTLRQITRLKLLKRQMYGHARFNLLHSSVLHRA